jgi:hypothetical protein
VVTNPLEVMRIRIQVLFKSFVMIICAFRFIGQITGKP